MTDHGLELALLRHDNLPARLNFSTGGRDYCAQLSTPADALAPAYALQEGSGATVGTVVLPSVLEDVELHLLAWVVTYDYTRSRRSGSASAERR